MADIADTEVKGADDASVDSSGSDALTPEQRDEQTISRLLGGEAQDDGSDASADEPEGDEDDSDEDAGDEADGGEDNADDDELPEVTDEELEQVLDALDDRILAHPRIQKVLEDKAKAEADRRYEERRKSETVSQESERLIQQGRKAVTNIAGLYDQLQEQLKKAADGEDVGELVKVDKDALMTELGAFGAAAVAEVRRGFDDAFAESFREGALLAGDVTDEEKETVVKIVTTAQRIANDPKQGRDKATAHLFGESIKFLVGRAKAAGRAEAVAEFQKRKDALKKVVGENGTKAAVAEIANKRKKLPTKPAAVPAQASEGRATMEEYRAAKKAGDHARADEIAAQLASS